MAGTFQENQRRSPMLRLILMFSSLIILLLSPTLYAAEKTTATATVLEESGDARRAKALLAKAIDYYKENKDRALAAFSRSGEFINGDLYVYVLGMNGHMLASGGSSAALIGRDVSSMLDATGKSFFREMIDTAKGPGTGTVEYRWHNRADGKVERKVTYFQKVDDRIIAVGFFIPRASSEQANSLLEQAVKAVAENPLDAFVAFNDLNGKFVQDDLYVFVVDLKDIRFRAHGASPRLVGTYAKDLKDPTGKPIIKQMITSVKTKGQGSLDYKWLNPVTNKIESKHTLLRKVSNYLVGVGYYTR
jgi:cytochrome c